MLMARETFGDGEAWEGSCVSCNPESLCGRDSPWLLGASVLINPLSHLET